MLSSESSPVPGAERMSPGFKPEMSSFLGLLLVVLVAGGPPALDLGRAGDLALGVATVLVLFLAGLTSGLKCFTLEAALGGLLSA